MTPVTGPSDVVLRQPPDAPSVTLTGARGSTLTFVASVAPGRGATAYADCGDEGGFYVEIEPAMAAYLAGWLAHSAGVLR